MTPNNSQQNSKPVLLKALELIVARPAEIKQKVDELKEKYRQRFQHSPTQPAFFEWMASRIISAYSTKAGFSGGATAFIGIVPGMGTAVRLLGGTTADIALCLKYQIEMTMALAYLYGQDIETEAGKQQHFLIAGLATAHMETIRQGGEQASRLFSGLLQRYLHKTSFESMRIIFLKASITLSKKALQKAIPFGIGAAICFSSNKLLTQAVGHKANVYFAGQHANNVLIPPYNQYNE